MTLRQHLAAGTCAVVALAGLAACTQPAPSQSAAQAVPAAGPATPHYAVIGHIAGPPLPGWDYASVDADARRLYLGAKDSVILDLDTGTVAPPWPAGRMVHSVVPLHGGMLALDDGRDHAVRFVDAQTGQVKARIATGGSANPHGFHNPDAMIRDPKTGLLVVANGDSGVLLLVSPDSHKIVGRVNIGSPLEFLAADGRGKVYVNMAARHGIAAVDIATRAKVGEMIMNGCEDPSGLAYDAAHGLLMSVCGNGVLKLVDAASLTEVGSVDVAKGADAVMFDPMRHMVFIAGAEDGKLSVLRANGVGDTAVVQTIDTAPGVRLGAVDPQTGKVYLPVVQVDLKAKPVSMLPGFPPRPPAIENTFGFMVVGPQ